jgi:hypothetical protein
MTERYGGRYGLPVFAAVAISSGLAASWWYLADPKTIGWLMIVSIFAVPSAILAYRFSFSLADRAGRLVSLSGQILIAAFLPGLLILLYSLSFKQPNPVMLAALISVPGGLAGSLILYLTDRS